MLDVQYCSVKGGMGEGRVENCVVGVPTFLFQRQG